MNISVLIELYTCVASHAHDLNWNTALVKKLGKVCNNLALTDPPFVHFENESYQNQLDFLHALLMVDNASIIEELNIESRLVRVCENVLQIYLNCTQSQKRRNEPEAVNWTLPLSMMKKEELAARTSLVVSALQLLSGLRIESFKKHVSNIFPLLIDVLRSEHSSRQVQLVLGNLFQSCIGPIIMQ